MNFKKLQFESLRYARSGIEQHNYIVLMSSQRPPASVVGKEHFPNVKTL